MDITGLAEAALSARVAMARQGLSVAMVKQNLEMDQAAVQLLTQAADQVTQSASAAAGATRGRIIDIVV